MDEGANIPGTDPSLQSEDLLTSGKGRHPSYRRIWLALALLVVFGIIAWLWWDHAHRAPPQIITFPNGERYQFAGVTYGTNNVPPYFPARLVHWLPKRLADPVRKWFGTSVSQYNRNQKIDTPRLFVWFRRLDVVATTSNTVPSLTVRARLADQSGVEAGMTATAIFSGKSTWSSAEFTVLPRRSRTLQCNFYAINTPVSTPLNTFASIGSVTFPNPLYRQYPQWQPEPMPAVKQAGNVEVHLNSFETGPPTGLKMFSRSPGSEGTNRPARRGEDSYTVWGVSLVPDDADEIWTLHSAKLSDATGNLLASMSHGVVSAGLLDSQHIPPSLKYSEFVSGMLWPDESALLVKMELKRNYGFSADETVTFKNVPVPAMGATNIVRLTNHVGGIQIVFLEFSHGQDMNMQAGGLIASLSQVRFVLSGKPTDAAIDLVNISSDAGKVDGLGFLGAPSLDKSTAIILRSIPANAKTMDFTFVVQKTRTVEFLVKPPKPD